jgi:hypothetical protein
MGKKATHFNQIIHLLQELKKEYPSYHLSQHLASALGDYKDLWGIADKEMLFALTKYKAELEFNIASDQEVDQIMRDAQNLDKLLHEEEEDYDN